MANRRERFQVEEPDSKEKNLSYQLRHTPWRERLNTLGSRWVPNTPENSAAFLAQVSEAWELAYFYIWNLRGKNSEHANYTDDERCDAAVHMRTALINYDPSRQDLVKFVEQKSILLLKGAWSRGMDIEYDAPEAAEDPRHWEQELEELQRCADGTAEWVGSAADLICGWYASRIRLKFPNEEQRRQVISGLKAELASYEPHRQPLKEFVEQWLLQILDGEKKTPETKGVIGVSIDTRVGKEGESTIGELIPDNGPSVETQVSERLAAWEMLTDAATVLNFQSSRNRNILYTSEEHRHHRMCYTERLLFLAQHSTLPGEGRRAALEALLRSYLEHFTVMPETGGEIKLSALTFRTMEQILDPDSPPETWTKPIEWSGASDSLPAKVPISYLRRQFDEQMDDPGVNKMRRSFYQFLRKLAAPRYTAGDIREMIESP